MKSSYWLIFRRMWSISALALTYCLKLVGGDMRFTTTGATAALLLASIAPAVAQAPPPPPPPPMVVPGMNWTGLYGGVEFGRDWGKFPGSVTVGATAAGALPGSPAVPAGTAKLSESNNGSFAGGGQLGYNWHLPSNW